MNSRTFDQNTLDQNKLDQEAEAFMPFKHLSCEQLNAWIEAGTPVNIIDIRDQQSYLQGHINNAQHIHNENLESFIGNTEQSTPLVVCCYHGNSSQSAADYFNQRGFNECYSLAGGFEDWRNKFELVQGN